MLAKSSFHAHWHKAATEWEKAATEWEKAIMCPY
jgi:hypothetical protein